MKDYNHDDLENEQHNYNPKSEENEIEEVDEVEHEFIPKDEDTSHNRPFKGEFIPRDEDGEDWEKSLEESLKPWLGEYFNHTPESIITNPSLSDFERVHILEVQLKSLEYLTLDHNPYEHQIKKLKHYIFELQKRAGMIYTSNNDPKSNLKIGFKKVENKLIIKSFPKSSRIIICEEIYKKLKSNVDSSDYQIANSIVRDLISKSSDSKWNNKLSVKYLREIREKLSGNTINNETVKSFKDYFNDLSNLVKRLRDLNINKEKINFSELSRSLIKKNKNLNLSKRGLEVAIAEIYEHLTERFDDFKLERRKSKSTSGTESEKESIRCLRKELKLLNELNNGEYRGKCSNTNCLTDYKRLPAINFHHQDPKIKKSEWNEIMHKDYDIIKRNLESENVKPICNNCHLTETAKIYNGFEDIITKEDLFTISSEKLSNLINIRAREYIKQTKTKYIRSSLKFEVLRWIKKRAVIDQVFNGKCVSCEEKRLPALQIHHTNPDLKKFKWGQISRKWSSRDLINKFIIKEECVCLCGNCHSMISTKNYENNISKIIGEKDVEDVRKDYEEIHRKIRISSERIKRIKQGKENLITFDNFQNI